MKRSVFFACFFAVVVAMTGCSSSGGGEVQKQLTDREVLMLIFTNLNGENWSEKAKENWGSELPLSKWNGVKADENDRVTELYLRGDSIKGTYPTEIGQLTELKSMSILGGGYKATEQPFPASIGDLTNLESLTLDGRLKDIEVILPPVGKLVNLKTLNLYGKAKAPEGIEQLTNLTEFIMNGLAGEFPAAVSKLTSLEKLDLRGYSFTGAIPSDIGNLKKLRSLTIDKSQFIGGAESLAGTLPESIWDLENLDYLFIRGIVSTGTLSPKIANLKKMKDITIIECGLTGEIPVEVYSLPELKKFSVYKNNLTGTISPEIGNLEKLEDFSINDNQFTGTLPATMGKLSKLRSLHVQKNLFTGAIPAELAKCPLGTFVDFTGNQFSTNIAPALKAHKDFEKWKIDK